MNEKELMTGLASQDITQRRMAARSIKNAIIGSQLRKSLFVDAGVAEALSTVLKDETDKTVLIETSAVIGSFALGNPRHTAAICTKDIVTQLLLRLRVDDAAIVEACIRTLKTLIKTGFVKSHEVQQILTEDVAVKLVQLLGERLNVALYAATVIANCCVTIELKRWLVQQNGMVALMLLLDRAHNSESPDAVVAVLEVLQSLTQGPGAALCCASLSLLTFPIEASKIRTTVPVQQHLCRLLHHTSSETRFIVAQCLANMLHEKVEKVVGRSVPDVVLAAIIRLLKEPALDKRLQIEALKVFGRLVENHESLQRMAVENNTIVLLTNNFKREEAKANGLLQASLVAMAAVCSRSDHARKHVVGLDVAWDNVVACLTDGDVGLRRAASACILSMSRSVGTLRTTLVESGVTKPLCNMFLDSDMKARCTAVAAICNLVLEFSPAKKLAMDLGVIAKLVDATFSPCEELRLNSVWGLKNLLYEADDPDSPVTKSRVMNALSWTQLWKLVDDEAESVQVQAIGVLRNLVHGSDKVVDDVLRGCGGASLFFDTVETKLAKSNGKCIEQLLFVLCNVSSGSKSELKEQILARHSLLKLILSQLAHPIPRVKVAALWCIINLTDPDSIGAQPRQKTLMGHNVLRTVVQLSTFADLDVKDRSKTVLAQFSRNGFGAPSWSPTIPRASTANAMNLDALDIDFDVDRRNSDLNSTESSRMVTD